MYSRTGSGFRRFSHLVLVVAFIVAAGSLTACGKKGSLEKPGKQTESTTKKKTG